MVNRMTLELDATKTQLALFYVILLLTVDSINPIKIILHVFPQIKPWHIATVSILAMIYIFISEMKAILYFSVKVFFHSILSIFFRDVQVVGIDNIPANGPVIFTGNHANQFVDGVSIFATCQRTISYLVAEKSWNRRIIGDLAWAMGAVPVKRAQDSAVKGTGTVTTKKTEEGLAVMGDNTRFTKEMGVGDKIRIGFRSEDENGEVTNFLLKVTDISDDKLLYVDESSDIELPPSIPSSPFDILKHVDQTIVYEKVLNKLASGGTIGIFPEGGSHDRTDLLPLKVGVALISYAALEKHGHSVPIVPAGLNYFRGHRFRGRLIVEYGSPIYVDPTTLDAYKAGGAEKRRVCNELLERIQDSMRSVLVTTPDYRTLELIYTARRLYQRSGLDASHKQDLNRRFAEGYRRLLEHSDGTLPPEWADIQARLASYQKELNQLGIRDYQVIALGNEKYDFKGDEVLREMRIPYRILLIMAQIAISLVPAIFLNLPVGYIARIYAEARRKTALANSKVKIHANDVMLSEKIVLCIALVPTLWFIYALLLFFFTDLDGPSIALAIFSMPLFSYVGIMATEAGVVNVKDLKPHVMRLRSSTRRRLSALPAVRKQLQTDLRHLIKEFGPTLGEVYYEKKLNWTELQGKVRKSGEKIHNGKKHE